MGSAYFDAHSLWQRADKPLFTSLAENLQTEVCVVGAGISGLSTAYFLLKAGIKVAVVDRERLGLGETGLTSAHLSNALDEGYLAIRRQHGDEGARLAAESHTQAINEIERIQRTEVIDCDFRRTPGYLFLKPEGKVTDLIHELEAVHDAGLSQVRLLPSAPQPLFDTGPCLEYPMQAQFHPLKYLDGLATAVQRLGGRIFTHTEVTEVTGGTSATVMTKQGFKIECQNAVIATDAPIVNRIAVQTKIAAYRSYMIGLPVPEERVERALFWDTASPYHYLRFVKEPGTGQDILLIGGEDHRTGQDADPEVHFANLQRWARERLDLDARPVTRWSGQILEPVDGLAYIGKNPGEWDNIFLATGDSGHGLTHGTIAGLLIRDLILDRPNEWQALYDPDRLHFSSLGHYLKEAVQSTAPYADWFTPADVSDVGQIPIGEGAIVRDGVKKVAAYKDEMGRLFTCSAVCPHLGGVVRWNDAEKTWDCPCHGSRFDRYGQVLNGPANQELAPVDIGGPSPEAETLLPGV